MYHARTPTTSTRRDPRLRQSRPPGPQPPPTLTRGDPSLGYVFLPLPDPPPKPPNPPPYFSCRERKPVSSSGFSTRFSPAKPRATTRLPPSPSPPNSSPSPLKLTPRGTTGETTSPRCRTLTSPRPRWKWRCRRPLCVGTRNLTWPGFTDVGSLPPRTRYYPWPGSTASSRVCYS